MTVWREVQEALYARWLAMWTDEGPARTETVFVNEEDGPDPEPGPFALFEVNRRPSGPGTIGAPGRKKMDRRGVVFIRLRARPGQGVGELSDLAELAADVFENCRVDAHHIRFAQVDHSQLPALVDDGRYWGVTVEAPFDYEQIK